MDIFSNYKDEILKFMCSSAFIGAAAMFLIYLLVWKVLRGTWNLFIGMLMGFLSLLSPMRFRRVAVNTLSLIFMTASFALFAGANAKLHDRAALLEAILGGSLAVGIWSLVMFAVNLIRGDPKPKKKVRGPNRGRPVPTHTSGKVFPPSNME